MTILVLGGAGYIGSHTVYELIENGEDVAIIDNLQTGHIKAVHPKARFYKGDIRNREFLDSVFAKEKIDAVIHFAAYSLVGESMEKPLTKLYFHPLQQLMENLKVCRSWKRTKQSQQIHMEKQNWLWKKCLNGLEELTI